MTDQPQQPHPTAVAAAALGVQVAALLQLAGRHRAGAEGQLSAVRAMRWALLDNDDNDRGALATSTAVLAVMAHEGEIGSPPGKVLVAAQVIVTALVALDAVGCQEPGRCPGPDAWPVAPVVTCPRCLALAGIKAETTLTPAAFRD